MTKYFDLLTNSQFITRTPLTLTFILLISIGSVGVVGGTNVVSLDADETPAITEYLSGTDPFTADSDGDGLSDTTELEGPTDPTSTDTDGDGLNDSVETNGPTDPTKADTDGDGLNDSVETNGPTDPTVADTDDDGLNDTEERQVGTDPTVGDTDGDGLGDGTEMSLATDPLKADTDGDGLDDGEEVNGITDPTKADTDDDGLDDKTEVDGETSPVNADTDDDGLDDGEEVEEYGTDPTAVDTDGDGLSDSAEVHRPALSDSDPLQKDIFVEVDYMSGHRPSDSAIESVEDAYAEAPVDNPDGSTGINLHIVLDEEVPSEDTTNRQSFNRLKLEHADYSTDGYHYGVGVDSARLDGEDSGGFGTTGRFVFETEYDNGRGWPSSYTAHTFMHELGHSVGLSPSDYKGIDSREVPDHEYQSVMNYESRYSAVEYNDGGPFDDWQHIEDDLYTPLVSGE